MKLETIVVPVESSNIEVLTRVPANDLMIVEFVNGTKYLYTGVDVATFNQLVDAESVGKEFNSVIKKGDYNYLKV